MGIGLVFAVLASGWCCIHNFLYTIGSDAQTDGAVAGAIEPIAVVRFVRHEAEGYSVVDFSRKNRWIHIHRIFMSGDVADSEIRCKGRDKKRLPGCRKP